MITLPEIVQRSVARHQELQLAQACEMARVGVRTVQSGERTADTARRRAVVAWILTEAMGWRQHQVATALNTSVRQVRNQVKEMRRGTKDRT
jgi:hypothetical protein